MIYKHFFASMNTESGFKNCFDKIFDPTKLSSLYIIKGGSGTGKSTLMKKIARHFDGEGKDVEAFLCSADTNSYDGIIIDSKTAVIDGTSPHTTDPVFSGAVDEIIDLGVCLDTELLRKSKEEIISLVEKKKAAYKNAFSFLSAGCKMRHTVGNIAGKNINEDKMLGAIKRFFKQNNLKGDVWHEKIRLITSITHQGEVSFDTFEKMSDKILCITNAHGCEGIFFSKFLDEVKSCGLEAVLSLSPYKDGDVNGIYLPRFKTCLVLEKGDEDTYDTRYKMFNLERFIDKNVLSENRAKLRFASKCSASLINEASLAFLEAKQEHEKLEEIYKTAVDFDKVGDIGRSLIDKINKTLVI